MKLLPKFKHQLKIYSKAIKNLWKRYILWRIKFPATILFLARNHNLTRIKIAYLHHKEVFQYHKLQANFYFKEVHPAKDYISKGHIGQNPWHQWLQANKDNS